MPHVVSMLFPACHGGLVFIHNYTTCSQKITSLSTIHHPGQGGGTRVILESHQYFFSSITTTTQMMNEVIPGLWIGDLPSAMNVQKLNLNIYSILSAMRGRITVHVVFMCCSDHPLIS
jgi:hypothetical protein